MKEQFDPTRHVPAVDSEGFVNKYAGRAEEAAQKEADALNQAEDKKKNEQDASRPWFKRVLGIGKNPVAKEKSAIDILEEQAHKDNTAIDAATAESKKHDEQVVAAWNERIKKIALVKQILAVGSEAIPENPAFIAALKNFREAEGAADGWSVSGMSGDDLVGAGYVGPAEFRRTREEASKDLAGEQGLSEADWNALLIEINAEKNKKGFDRNFLNKNWELLKLENHKVANEYFLKNLID